MILVIFFALSLPFFSLFVPPSLPSFFPSLGTITLTQLVSTASSCVIPSSTCWVVEGLASFEHGGCCPTEFYFICNSDKSDASLEWSRSGGSLTKSQVRNGNGGIELRFTNPIENDASVYKCTDTINQEFKTLNITDGILSTFIHAHLTFRVLILPLFLSLSLTHSLCM